LDKEIQQCKLCNDNNYIENCFAENINVTAIVGKNGSGKSSLLYQKAYRSPYIKVFFSDEIIHIIFFGKNGISDLRTKNQAKYNVKINNVEENDYTVYFNWDVVKPNYPNWYTHYFGKDDLNILLPLIRTKDYIFDVRNFDTNVIKKIIEFNNSASFETFFYKPHKLTLHIVDRKEEELKKSIIGQKIFSLKPDEREMTFDNFFNLFYKKNKEDINRLLSEKIIILKITDEKGRDFFDLSYGERSIFITNLILLDKIKEKNTNLIVYLDEPDLTLHPEWQRRFVDNLVKVFSSCDKQIHFVITTHSPFLISDLPRENIIFLEDGKEANGLNGKKQTFGANIHTLLSDSFFMEDGLMGEFAKSKIN
jgi:predicted ATP-dependent endonuclease of OLD family